MTKTYNSKIENGLKSSLYSIERFMESESVTDSRVEAIREKLVDLIVEAQLGTIDNKSSDVEQEYKKEIGLYGDWVNQD